MRQYWCGIVLLSGAALLTVACDDQGGKDDGPRAIGPRMRTSAALRTYSSCEDLTSALKNSLSEQMRVLLEENSKHHGQRWAAGGDDTVMEADASATDSGNSAGGGDSDRQEGVDFSGTNNQEQGVDEADFVKTDGYFVYTLNGGRLEIFEVPEYGQLEHRSTTQLEGHPSQMLKADDRAVVFSSIYPWYLTDNDPLRPLVATDEGSGWYRSQSLTKLTVLDITNRSAPTVQHEIYIEGYYQTARKVDSSVRMVSHAFMDIPGLRHWVDLPAQYWRLDHESDEAKAMLRAAIDVAIAHNEQLIAEADLSDFIPQIYERNGDSFTEHPFTDQDCANFAAAGDAMSRGVTSILSLNLFDETFTFDADHVLTNWSTVYASKDTMLIAEPAQDWWWYWNNDDFEEASNIHRFDISDPSVTTYTGSGRIDGTINDQFSLSEYEGAVRVASTTGQWNRWWVPAEEQTPSENHVFVLEGETQLDVIGSVSGIAVGERIWSSRFVGERAYLVTFRNIDPLFTINLSDKTNPRIEGELKVPGVSTYIHPVDEDHLLTIGYDGDDNGLNWSVKISLFDVSDFGNPTVASELSLSPSPTNEGDGWQHSWSEATHEHKAFQYWGPKKLLAIPLSSWRYVHSWQSGGRYDSWEYKSRLQLINVDAASGLSLYGEVDHSSFFEELNCFWNWVDVRRSIFMQDYIYAISDRGLTAHHLDDLTTPTASKTLPGMSDLHNGCW